ncbi:Transcriptional regulator, GntR family protein / Aspartate aminotransferase [Caballeronia sordidicola]|uniref:Transcriptional regulator, GntR family protein / Aspartate aminotransferase n=1 Tax=Caballeronia sordidicola TaxID=196367 RepID=A0A242N452_CABSO|nr:Transcriptional regulator, GntR family protein / Aspartate aminotransferase [Caballeronia sordidicola]
MAVTATLDNLGFQPNPDASQPLYVQLTVALADAIRTGRI